MKLWQANFLAHELGKNLRPFLVFNICKMFLNPVLLVLPVERGLIGLYDIIITIVQTQSLK